MVHELPPGHHQHRDRVVVEAVVLVHAGRHRARARQREPGGRHAGRGHAVSVVRSQEPVTCHDVMWPSRVTCHVSRCHVSGCHVSRCHVSQGQTCDERSWPRPSAGVLYCCRFPRYSGAFENRGYRMVMSESYKRHLLTSHFGVKRNFGQ